MASLSDVPQVPHAAQEGSADQDRHSTEDVKLALCLSGGGLRATFFHLGMIRFLRDADLLRQVTRICSVSGGTILAAHLVLNWDKYTGTDADFEKVERELINFGSRDVRGRVIRRWLLALMLPLLQFFPAISRRTKLLEREYSRLFNKALLHDLSASSANPRPELHMLATSFTTGNLCSFSKEGFWIDDGKSSKLYATGLIPLSLAVAASSAFPPLFPPVMITRKMLDAAMEDLPYDPEYLSDGGVFDNLGFKKFLRLHQSDKLRFDCLLLSDAGARFDWDTGSRFAWVTSRTVRSTDILMKRVADATLSLANAELAGAEVIHVPISDIVSEASWAGVLPADFQKRLSKVRTDLDQFSPLESDLLSRHGYESCLARSRLSKTLAPHTEGVGSAAAERRVSNAQTLSHTSELLDRSRERRTGLWSIRDWASFALVGWLGVLVALVNLPFVLQMISLSEKEERLERKEAALYSLSPDRISSFVFDALLAGPQYFDALVIDILRQAGDQPTPENIKRARIQLANYIDGKYIGIIAAGPNVGKVGILLKPSFVTVSVTFATDRAQAGRSDVGRAFSSERARTLSIGTADVSVPTAHRVGALEAPPPRGADMSVGYLEKYFMVRRVSLDAPSANRFSGQQLQILKEGALVYVHGFNTSFDMALMRTAQLARDLDIKSLPIAFSWPSQGSSTGYIYDRESAGLSRSHLSELFALVRANSPPEKIDVIAQGMGGATLLDAMRDASIQPGTKKPLLGQVIFVVPDVSADYFVQTIRVVAPYAERVTVYVAPNDPYLSTAKAASSSPRAGSALAPVGGIDVISVPGDFNEMWPKVLSDVHLVIQRTPIQNRFGLRRQGDLWSM
jgi:esterase/lipase superfamily enzyme/predicted acylesterase/phospholipase RssA